VSNTKTAFGDASARTGNKTSSLQKDAVYGYALSETYAAENASAYDAVANNLHVMALTGYSTELVCNRAGSGSSNTASAGNDSTGGSSAKSTAAPRAGAGFLTVGMLALAALVVS
jgi:hypothetical protein